MKPFRLFALVCLITGISLSSSGQIFLKQHAFTSGPTKYSCIASMGTNYIIAGTQVSGVTNYIVLVEIDPSGNIVNEHRVKFSGGSEPVIPLGIVWDDVATDQYIVVAGYIGSADPDFANPFVFKYNYNTNAVVWTDRISKIGIYTDLDKLSTGDYVVSGEIIDIFGEQENGLIYKINKNTGVATELYEATEELGGSDTYFALTVNNDKVYTTGRFELHNADLGGMRPVITSYNTSTGTASSNYYLKAYPDAKNPTNPARLYPLDISRVAGNYYTIVTGDIDGTLFNRDLYVIRTTTAGTSSWQRRIKLTAADDCEGQLNSIKLYTPGPHLNFPVVFGTLCNGGTIGTSAFMFRLSQNGSTVQWINRYDAQVQFNTFGNLCPNSMIINGDKIIAVGWSMYENIVGAVLCTSVNDGIISDCSAAMTLPTTENTDIEATPALTNPTVSYILTEMSRTVDVPTSFEYVPCEEIGVTGGSGNNKENTLSYPEDYLVTIQQSSEQVDFYLTADETAASYSIQIIDMAGRSLMTNDIEEGTHVSASLPGGMYISILYENGQLIESQKFVVK